MEEPDASCLGSSLPPGPRALLFTDLPGRRGPVEQVTAGPICRLKPAQNVQKRHFQRPNGLEKATKEFFNRLTPSA
jgi:hypothetical protein